MSENSEPVHCVNRTVSTQYATATLCDVYHTTGDHLPNVHNVNRTASTQYTTATTCDTYRTTGDQLQNVHSVNRKLTNQIPTNLYANWICHRLPHVCLRSSDTINSIATLSNCVPTMKSKQIKSNLNHTGSMVTPDTNRPGEKTADDSRRPLQASGGRKRGPRRSKQKINITKRSVGILNANGLHCPGKCEELLEICRKHNIEICVLTETHFRDDEAFPVPTGYQWLGCNRVTGEKRGGGIGALFPINASGRTLQTCHDHMWIEVTLNPALILIIGIVYLGTGPHAATANTDIRRCIAADYQKLFLGSYPTLICGDFNAHISELDGKDDSEGEALKLLCHQLELRILNLDEKCQGKTTWQRAGSKSSIDYALANDKAYAHFNNMKIDEEGQISISSDHNMLQIFLTNLQPRNQRSPSTNPPKNSHSKWNVKNLSHVENFSNIVSHTLSSRATAPTYDELVDIITAAAEQTCGNTKPPPSGKWAPKWLKPDIKTAIKLGKMACREHRHSLQRGDEKHITAALWKRYLDCKNKAKSLIASSKHEHDVDLTRELTSRGYEASQKFRRHLKSGKTTPDTITPKLRDNNGNETDDISTILSIITGHFTNNVQIPTQDIALLNGEPLNQPYDYPNSGESECELLQPFSETEVGKAIKKLPSGKSPGVDRIPYELIKALDKTGIVALTIAFNEILTSNNIPGQWRQAVVVLIYKGKRLDKLSIASYRPISLLCCFYKLFAKLITRRLYTFLENNKVLGDMQNGFRRYRSVNDNIFTVSEVTEIAKVQGHPVYWAFLDIKGAFDNVNRRKLITLLEEIGPGQKFASLLSELLSNTTNTYRWNGHDTDKVVSLKGVRQGCPLSGVLFSVYLIPFEKSLSAGRHGYRLNDNTIINGSLFADDAAVCAGTPADLQKQLDIATNFGLHSDLEFSPQKTVVLQFGNAETQNQNLPQLFTLQGKALKLSTSVVYLGLQICTDQENIFHYEYAKRINKAKRLKGLIKHHSKNSFNRYAVTRILWKQVAVPALTYAQDSIHIEKSILNQLDKIQVEMGKFALGGQHLTPHVTIAGEMGWSDFHSRDAGAKNNFLRHILNLENTSTVKKVFNAGIQSQTFTKWNKITQAYRAKYDLNNNIRDHPTADTWRDHTKKSLHTANDKIWQTQVDKHKSLEWYRSKKSLKPEAIYDNSLGSDLLFQSRTGCLPTAFREFQVYGESPQCNLCGAVAQTIRHILMHCPGLEEERKQLLPPQDVEFDEDDQILSLLCFSRPDETTHSHEEQLSKTKKYLERWWFKSKRKYPYWR